MSRVSDLLRLSSAISHDSSVALRRDRAGLRTILRPVLARNPAPSHATNQRRGTLVSVNRRASLLWACTAGLMGCATPQPKKTVVAPTPSSGLAETLKPVKKKRDLSQDAQAAFDKVVERYKRTIGRDSGVVDAARCSEIADAFAAVYSDYPKLAEAKFNEAAVWDQCGDGDRARRLYEELLAKHPNYGPALNNLGSMEMARGRPGAALRYFEQAAKSKNSQGYANLALLQRERALSGDRGALREAVNNIHRALAVDSFNIEAYYLLAALIYDHARTESQLTMARLVCLQAIEKRPKYAPIYNLLGLVLLKMQRVTPALVQFRAAISHNPDYVAALMNIGAVTLSFRDYASAERSFRRVLELAGDDVKVRYAATVGLGVALRGRRKFAEAMTEYEAAEKLGGDNGDIAYNMAVLTQDYIFDASDPAKAISQLQSTVQLLNRYISAGKTRSQLRDAKRRVKDIGELIPMLREQQRMQGAK